MIPLAQWQIVPTVLGSFALALLFCLLLIHNGEQRRWRRVVLFSVGAVICAAISVYVALTDPVTSLIG